MFPQHDQSSLVEILRKNDGDVAKAIQQVRVALFLRNKLVSSYLCNIAKVQKNQRDDFEQNELTCSCIWENMLESLAIFTSEINVE